MIKNSMLSVLCALSLLMVMVMVGCASKPQIRSGARFAVPPEIYIVKSGDTLSAISARYGMDYVKVAALNNIAEPYRIYVSQRIRLQPSTYTGKPIQTEILSPSVDIKRQKIELPNENVKTTDPIANNATNTSANSELKLNVESSLVTPPVMQDAATAVNSIKPLPNNVQNHMPDDAQNDVQNHAQNHAQVASSWIRPTQAAVLQNFNLEKNIKGIRFAGQIGDAILAAAAGQVVYADNGLKEYGNLILIKHADGYITAYAHNRKLLVKKDENVKKGQKIAEMGSSGTSMVMLEFQLRLNGKPIDPRSVLNLN